MTAPLIYSMAPSKFNSTKLASKNRRIVPALINQRFKHSGNMFASVDMFAGAAPMVLMQVPVKDALATIGTGLLALTSFETYLTKFSASTYQKDSGSNHTKWAATAGCAYISGWSIDQNGVCMAEVAVVPFTTDGTYPLLRTDNNAMITLDSEPLLHTLGPISINGAVKTGLQAVGVAMNHNVEIRVSDGDLYPRTAALLGGDPEITGRHLDPATLLTTLSLIGVAISPSVIAYWKSYDASTQVVSTANAISATVAAGRIMPGTLADDVDKASSMEFVIAPLSTTPGTTNPISISTSATAPAT